MPRKEHSPLEDEADKLLREWAVKVAAATGQDVGSVLRSAGLLTRGMRKTISEREMTFTFYARFEKESD